LYAGDGSAERGGGLDWTPDLPDRAEALANASAELTTATASHLVAADESEREMAELKLLAQATLDLAAANDLVNLAQRQGEEAEELETERGVSGALLLIELRDVLDAPVDEGLERALPEASEIKRSFGTPNPRKAKENLSDTAQDTTDDIVDAAAEVGKTALGGLTALAIPEPAAFLGKAAGTAIEMILDNLGSAASGLVEQAVRLIGQALNKLAALVGEKILSQAGEKAVDWLLDWLSGAVVNKAMKAVYEPKRIKDEVQQDLDSAGQELTAEPFVQARRSLVLLRQVYEKKADIANKLLKALKWVQKWLMALQPYGPVAVGALYLGAVGYTVYSGGDHLDWYHFEEWGRLDRVAGVRHLVKGAV
jgi:hypothetical protein